MKKLLCFLSLAVILIPLWGCTYKTTTVPKPTTELIIIDNSATTVSSKPATLLSYENPQYGFAFTYPDTWALTEQAGDGSSKNPLILLSQSNVQLAMEYGFLSEILGLESITLPSGEWIDLDPISFFDESLPSGEILEDGRVKLVAFPELSGVFLVNGLFFRITLQPAGNLSQSEIDFETDLLDEVNGIIESFSSIERTSTTVDEYPGWSTFLSMDYGLLLRYPPEWQLEETEWETVPGLYEKALSLTKDRAQLLLGYHFNSEYVPHTEGFLGGLLVDEGLVPFLGKEIPKYVLQYENKDKAVFYNSLEGLDSGGLVFNIRLQDMTTGAGYDLIEVKDADQLEAESILASLHQFTPALSRPGERIISQGEKYFLTFESCFDLDEGMQKPEDDITCDFVVKKVPGSSNQKVSFQPMNQAVYDFKTDFAEPPATGDCAASEELKTVQKTELVLDESYICFQTSVGRYGSFMLRGMTSDGVSFDWQTSSTVGVLKQSTIEGSGEWDVAVTLKDMSIPDGTVMKPGEVFTKTWQLLNKGTSTWTTDYAIRFETGNRLGAPYEVAIPSEVPPDGAVNISVEMTAPLEPGEYTGHWVMRNASGHRFGMGADGSKTFWVLIVVEAEGSTD
ncbi:MAG: hypothetical protein LLG42_04260 [Chloroflexi bacterium]|nr:hypothetical protein [Chloroflexota bacterium]